MWNAVSVLITTASSPAVSSIASKSVYVARPGAACAAAASESATVSCTATGTSAGTCTAARSKARPTRPTPANPVRGGGWGVGVGGLELWGLGVGGWGLVFIGPFYLPTLSLPTPNPQPPTPNPQPPLDEAQFPPDQLEGGQ